MTNFLDVYLEYRDWWYQNSSSYSAETFEDHVNSMGLYAFMELMSIWKEG